EFWGEAIRMAAYLRNRCLKKKSSKTPRELFTGEKPNLANLHVFGSRAMVMDETQTGKLNDKAVEGIFLGYGIQVKGLVFCLIKGGKRAISRNLKFIRKGNEKQELTRKQDEDSSDEEKSEIWKQLPDNKEKDLKWKNPNQPPPTQPQPPPALQQQEQAEEP